MESTKSMGKKQKIKVFRAKLTDICSSIEKNSISVEERLRLYDLRYEIEEALDFMEPAEESVTNKAKKTNEGEKKIKFAEVNDVKQFNKQEAACKVRAEENKSDDTLFLNIKHSPAANPNDIIGSGEEIKSPADIYRIFCNEVSNTKSILKNKDMVLAETHNEIPVEKKSKKKTKKAQFNEMPIDVVGDIVERKSEEVIDETAEKSGKAEKKVSKFKKSRFR